MKPTLLENFSLKNFKTNHLSKILLAVFDPAYIPPGTLPAMVLRGRHAGPTLTLTGAVHGNELNGMRVIQRLIKTIKPKLLSGNILALPAVNVPGVLSGKREFLDRIDLNRVFPGKKSGTPGQIFSYKISEIIFKNSDYLIDLHTANTGRENSFYVRTDMTHKITSQMAHKLGPQIILHHTSPDGSLRGAAMNEKIPSVTVEVGNPLRFEDKIIDMALQGILRVMEFLKMLPKTSMQNSNTVVLCKKSRWLYTRHGGFAEVYPQVTHFVKMGDLIARIHDFFGDVCEEIFSPDSGIVIGKNTFPVVPAGGRLIHLGEIEK